MRDADGADAYVPFDPATGAMWPDWTSTVRESADVLGPAPAAIFIENTGTFSRGREMLVDAIRARRIGSLVAYTFEILGVGAAVENMWIAANALGLAASFMGDVVIAEAAIGPALGLEGDLVGVLAVGYETTGSTAASRTDAGADAEHVVWHHRMAASGPGDDIPLRAR